MSDWFAFDGAMAMRGVDPLSLPFDRFLHLVYAHLIEHADKKQREEIDKQLMAPPANVKAEVVAAQPEWADGAAGNQFMAQMALRGGAGRVGAQGIVATKVAPTE